MGSGVMSEWRPRARVSRERGVSVMLSLSLLGAKGLESGWLVSLGQWQEGTLRSSVPRLPGTDLAGTVVTTAVYVSEAGSHSPWSISWRRRCIWDVCVCVCVCVWLPWG